MRRGTNRQAPIPIFPLLRLYRMRAYCRLTDAELAISDLAKARRYAELSLPLVNAFSPTSPDLKILNAVGSCYESLGNVQRFIALDQSVSTVNRQAAETEARRWYQKSFDLWTEWNWRGTATPESEAERRKLQRLLKTTVPIGPDAVSGQSGR